jgi:hypothetical protein
VTHRVALGSHVWVLFEPPAWFMRPAAALRNSIRMAWPLAYALMFGAILACVRTWGGRRTGWLLLGLLALQWVDLRPGIASRGVAAAAAPRAVPERLPGPFWAEAVRRYGRVRCAPAANIGPGWERVGVLTARAGGVPTDCIYLARVDDAALAALRAKVAEILRSGAYEPDTLYVLRDEASQALAQVSHDPARDLLLEADGFWALAPGWHQAR